jgi:hypothetical protein
VGKTALIKLIFVPWRLAHVENTQTSCYSAHLSSNEIQKKLTKPTIGILE